MSTVPSIEKLIHEGRFLEARSIAEKHMVNSLDKRTKQLLALSMSKSGALKGAIQLLEPVYKEDSADPETSGILGSIYKEAFKLTRNTKYAILSRDTYLNNFTATGSFYTGINAASMYAISGSGSKAREIAKQLVEKLKEDSTDPWEIATIAEAYLLLKQPEKALSVYLKTRTLLGSDWGKVGSIYNQLWLLNHYVPVSKQVLAAFAPPVVAAFVGHMTDHPNRQVPRFPEAISEQVKKAIREAINTVNAKIGFCAVACGADILFAEAMLESGGEVHIFMPFDENDFLETSINFAAPEWKERYHKLIQTCPVTYVTKERYNSMDELFTFQTQVIFGAAVRRAAMLHGKPHLITVFAESNERIKEGGTRDTLKLWPVAEKRVNVNPVQFIPNSTPAQAAQSITTSNFGAKDERRHIRYLLAVDLSGVLYPENVHHLIKQKTDGDEPPPMDRTDKSYIIAFTTVKDAVGLAFDLLQSKTSAGVKVALHAGPVYINKEAPFIEGPSVEILKEIESHAVAGKTFTSPAFAEVLSIDTAEYAIESAGSVSSANGEKIEIYQLNRHSDVFDL